MASEVFFMSDRASSMKESIPFKAVKLFRDAGLGGIFKPGDTVGLKVHLGEWGNSHNLRPQYVSCLADEIKRLGGKPVVVECNTAPYLEYASRATTADHLRVAARHGFTEETMGCPIWICDGEYGFDDVRVEVPHGVFLKYAYMGKRLLELDALVAVTHFKGHPMGVFGGALKNIGIGCGSKRGKMTTHLHNHPIYGRKHMAIDQAAAAKIAEGPKPTLMDRLLRSCPFDAMSYENGLLKTDPERCRQCMCCIAVGIRTGVIKTFPEAAYLLSATIADSASAYINALGREHVGFVNYAMDITPWCDCGNYHDRALVPNIGVFASKDPVACDLACMEAVEALVAMPGSKADEFGFGEPETERFTNLSSGVKMSQWIQINAGVYNGLGSSRYNLILSEPGPDVDFWFKPYTPEQSIFVVHRADFASGNWTPDYPYSYDEPRLSVPELICQPKGKLEEIDIKNP